ncbi:MAG: hypothetical protein Q7J31_00215, partial [Syntrophales bacterium]|nr:hypothetical protein [Syntrophales bacterium]
CGEPLKKNSNKSKDHTPPVSIFPNEKPQNLTTIPCCITCNAEFAPIDEKMRNFFAILAGDVSADVIVPPFSGGRCPPGAGEVGDEAQVSIDESLGKRRRYPLPVSV